MCAPLRVQILSFSCSFRQNICKIIGFWELAHPLRKILDPPLSLPLWTETSLDRNPPGQRPPGRNMGPGTETPRMNMGPATRQEMTLYRDPPCGQNDRHF